MEARIGRLGQTKVYLHKCFLIFLNEKAWKKILFGAVISLIVAWVIGDDVFVYQANTKSGAFALVCACIWIGIFNSIQSVCREREILKREHRTGMHVTSYILAHMLFELLQCLVQTLIIALLVWVFHEDELQDNGIFFSYMIEFFITAFLTMYSADALGLAVSCIVRSENAAMTVMPFLLIVQLVFSGLFFQLDDNISWLSSLTISKWGVDGICTSADLNMMPSEETILRAQIQYEEQGEDIDLYELAKSQAYEMEFDPSGEHMMEIWLALAGYTLVYAAVGAIGLSQVDRDKR